MYQKGRLAPIFHSCLLLWHALSGIPILNFWGVCFDVELISIEGEHKLSIHPYHGVHALWSVFHFQFWLFTRKLSFDRQIQMTDLLPELKFTVLKVLHVLSNRNVKSKFSGVHPIDDRLL